ncbi:hypothetical protein [Leclercia pneumoniae]|uniref:hypothetical protein n=1 Tax=Leclercia pneumoniae TaxID=2815358 RepID=UPI001F5F5869|nr:hypothetical protein [Leclercia pneumoniae]
MNESYREIVNDSTVALRTLAKLMPQLSSQSTLLELLETINHAFGARLSWITVDDENGLQQIVSAGEHPVAATSPRVACHLLERQHG